MNSFETEWERPEFDSVPMLAENAVYLLPGCDDTILRKTLQTTYRDFCKRSAALRTWRKILPEPGRAHYPIVPVLSGEIDCVTNVVFAHSRRPLRGWRVEFDPPVLHLGHCFETHEFVPSPNVACVQDRVNVGALPVEGNTEIPPHHDSFALWVEAVEVPHLNEERAPKAFLRRYGDAIVDGALARMMSMTNRGWSDPEQARQHGIAYANALSEARLRSNAGGPAANAGATMVLDMRSMV
jgi:hypothetical protein